MINVIEERPLASSLKQAALRRSIEGTLCPKQSPPDIVKTRSFGNTLCIHQKFTIASVL